MSAVALIWVGRARLPVQEGFGVMSARFRPVRRSSIIVSGEVRQDALIYGDVERPNDANV
jgi:hypothetical protein